MNLIEDFGGEGEVLHLAHANAYPIKSYNYFLNLFADSYKVMGLNQRPMWAVESAEDFEDWSVLATDLIEQLEAAALGPVYGLGHSMGAIATLIAAHHRPDLFKKIVLIEPVVLPEQVYGNMAKMTIEERKAVNPMMNIAAKRRDSWADKEEAKDYFESKTFFQKFSDQAKVDYLNHGLVTTGDGMLKLAYRREWEARIYGTTINPWPFLENTKVPCLLIRAEFSDVVRSEREWHAIKERARNVSCVQFDGGGHMLPMEDPEGLHVLIGEFLKTV